MSVTGGHRRTASPLPPLSTSTKLNAPNETHSASAAHASVITEVTSARESLLVIAQGDAIMRTSDLPSEHARTAWLSALVLAAVGLWCTRGMLDVVSGTNSIVRVGMLPPWRQLAGFVVAFSVLGAAAAPRRPRP